MSQEIIGKIRRLPRDIRHWAMDQSAPPRMLTDLWPHNPPENELTTELSNEQLFQHYLYIDGQEETSMPGSLAGMWNKHFHSYMLMKNALQAGALPYRKVREFLYEALAEPPHDGMGMIYGFWLEDLKKYEHQSMEVMADRRVIVRKMREASATADSPTFKAYLDIQMIYALTDLESEGLPIKGLTKAEAATIVEENTKNILKHLPRPVELSSVYTRHETTVKKKYKTHNNSMHWILSFIHCAEKSGPETAREVKPLVDYFKTALKYYDPAVGEPYMTGELLFFAKKYASKELRNFFKARVATAIPVHTTGVNEKDHLLSELVKYHYEKGHMPSAMKYLRKIRQETTLMHSVNDFYEDRKPEYPHPDELFNDVFLPLVAKRWNRDLEKLQNGEDSFVEHEKEHWTFMSILAGRSMAKKGDFSILNSDRVIAYIQEGKMDSHLDILTDIINSSPDSEVLVAAVKQRIEVVFEKYRNPDAKLNYRGIRDDLRDVKEALEAIFVLRSKGLA